MTVFFVVVFFTALGMAVKIPLNAERTGTTTLSLHPAAKITVCVILILFCMGLSYIALAALEMLTGFSIPWAAGSFALAAMVRSTTEMTDEEFPTTQSAVIRNASLAAAVAVFILL